MAGKKDFAGVAARGARLTFRSQQIQGGRGAEGELRFSGESGQRFQTQWTGMSEEADEVERRENLSGVQAYSAARKLLYKMDVDHLNYIVRQGAMMVCKIRQQAGWRPETGNCHEEGPDQCCTACSSKFGMILSFGGNWE